MRLRCIDVMVNYIHRFDAIPSHMAMGMAAHILFMKTTPAPGGEYYGEYNGDQYRVEDPNVALYADCWKNYPVEPVVNKIMGNEQLWGINFSSLNGFETQVSYWLQLMIHKGVKRVLEQHDHKNSVPDEK